MKFETTADPWERSRLVGEHIRALRESFVKMTKEQREELGKQGEVELKSGLQMLGRDKRAIEELIELVDPPPAH